jgi:putative heme iron utilization protein
MRSDSTQHGTGYTPPAAPLVPVEDVPRRSPAEEARTLVAETNVGSLATLTDDGAPWASLITYGALPGGDLVIVVSSLAEHGRNLVRDPRASIVVAETGAHDDPLAAGRLTVAGRVVRPEGDREREALDVYVEAVPTAEMFTRFGDSSPFVLEVERVRWIGGYGRMGTVDVADYAAAAPDPVGSAADAVAHLNADHADALLDMARALGGHPDATAARCVGADRYGLDLLAETPRGTAYPRVGYAAALDTAVALRAATVELTRRARAAEAARVGPA